MSATRYGACTRATVSSVSIAAARTEVSRSGATRSISAIADTIAAACSAEISPPRTASDTVGRDCSPTAVRTRRFAVPGLVVPVLANQSPVVFDPSCLARPRVSISASTRSFRLASVFSAATISCNPEIRS